MAIQRIWTAAAKGNIFCVTGRNATPSFEKQESILNEMAELVEIFVIFPLVFTLFSRWYDRYHSLTNCFESAPPVLPVA